MFGSDACTSSASVSPRMPQRDKLVLCSFTKNPERKRMQIDHWEGINGQWGLSVSAKIQIHCDCFSKGQKSREAIDSASQKFLCDFKGKVHPSMHSAKDSIKNSHTSLDIGNSQAPSSTRNKASLLWVKTWQCKSSKKRKVVWPESPIQVGLSRYIRVKKEKSSLPKLYNTIVHSSKQWGLSPWHSLLKRRFIGSLMRDFSWQYLQRFCKAVISMWASTTIAILQDGNEGLILEFWFARAVYVVSQICQSPSKDCYFFCTSLNICCAC